MNSLPRTLLPIVFVAISHAGLLAQETQQIQNPKIDYPGFLRDAGDVAKLREERRITEEKFIEMSAEVGAVILDARSAAKYKLLHIRGAKNLSLPDFTAEELARIIPEKTTRVLIYCNNNFKEEEQAFPSKVARAALNIYTFNTLHGYGYHNVYELGPLIDVRSTKLQLEGEKVVVPYPITLKLTPQQQEEMLKPVSCLGR
jgi:hypothetical protein